MKHGSMLLGTALFAGLGVGLFAQQPAPAPAPAAPAAPAVRRPDISGIWNRLDTSGAGSYTGLAFTFPTAQLRPEFAAKLPPQNFGGVGAPPPGFVPPAYDINAQAVDIPRCAAAGAGGGGGGRGGGGGSAPIGVDSLGISIMATNDVVIFVRDGAQGVARRVFLDGRKYQDPTYVAGQQTYGYWDGDVLTLKTKGFNSGVVGNGRGWTEPTTELTETFKLQNNGQRLIWTYTYDDPAVYLKPHTFDITFERLPNSQYIFETFCDSKAWFEDQAKQAAAGRGGAAAAPAGRGAGAGPAAPAAPAAGR